VETDDSGNRIQFIDTPENTVQAVTWNYGYDWLNRLTSVSRNRVTMALYSYDESDNRVEWERPQVPETWLYRYDDAGQVVDRSLSGSPPRLLKNSSMTWTAT
jgi:YD repeat-containing protein